MRTGNEEVSRVLETVADLLEVLGGEEARKAAAYRRAARSVRALDEDVADLHEAGRLTEIPGVGGALARKIGELIESGRLAYHERLAAEVPPGVLDLLRLPGVGPRTAGLLWRRLGVEDLETLEEAARSGSLRKLPGFGPKKEAAVLEGLAALRRRSGRIPLGEARPAALALVDLLSAVPGVTAVSPAGGVRRWCETVESIDIVAGVEEPEGLQGPAAGNGPGDARSPEGAGRAGGPGGSVAARVAGIVRDLPDVTEVLQVARDRVRASLRSGVEVDVRLVPARLYAGALRHFTGSREHNESLQKRAASMGLALGPEGVLEKGGRSRPARSEEEVYSELGLAYIPPELREGRGEVEAAAEGRLPRLVELSDIRGDLHVHTDWSDGHLSLEGLVEAARARGYEYVVVSDHSRSLAVTGGLDEERLLAQKDAIEELNRRLAEEGPAEEHGAGPFRLLAGVEVDILPDGRLDLPDGVLAEMDVVTASVHSALRQPGERMTERLVGAAKNEHVDVIGHPTGRLLGRREPSALDLEGLFEVCARTGTLLEINASPERLDLKDTDARLAKDMGCRFTVSTDAHHARALGDMVYGVATARRAWLEPGDVANTRSLADLRRLLR